MASPPDHTSATSDVLRKILVAGAYVAALAYRCHCSVCELERREAEDHRPRSDEDHT